MWLSAGAPPISVQYTDLAEFQRELRKVADGEGWILIRDGDNGRPDFEEYIKASSVVRYIQEVWR